MSKGVDDLDIKAFFNKLFKKETPATAAPSSSDENRFAGYSNEEVGKIILEEKKKKERGKFLNNKNVRKWAWALIRFLLILGLSYIILYPLILRVSVSFKTVNDVFDSSVVFIPKEGTLNNYKNFIHTIGYPSVLLYSCGRAAVAGLLQAISTLLVGYGFARFKFKGRGLVFMLVMFTMIIPTQVYILGMYLKFRFYNPLTLYNLDAFNTSGVTSMLFGLFDMNYSSVNLLGLSAAWKSAFGSAPGPIIGFFLDNASLFLLSMFAVGFKNGLFIYMFRQYFRGVPKELEEAAYIDGAGFAKTFFKVMLPGAVPMFVTVFLFGFVWTYNDIIFTQQFNGSSEQIMAIVIQSSNIVNKFASLAGGWDTPEVQLYQNVGVCLHLLPVIVLYIFCQRSFVQSIERSGLVG